MTDLERSISNDIHALKSVPITGPGIRMEFYLLSCFVNSSFFSEDNLMFYNFCCVGLGITIVMCYSKYNLKYNNNYNLNFQMKKNLPLRCLQET